MGRNLPVYATIVSAFRSCRPIALFPILLTALLVSSIGLPLHAKTLPTALTELLKNHPRIQEAEKQALAAGQDIRDADSGFLPKVSVTGDAGIETIDSPSRRDVTPEHSNMRRDSLTLTLTQNLFDGFATSSQSTIASLGQTRAKANLETVRQAVLFDGIAAYLDVLRTSELLKVTARNERTITTQLHLEQERVRRGSGLSVDVLQSEARLQVARERRVSIKGQLKTARSRYIELFDEPPEIDAMTPVAIAQSILPTTIEEALQAGRKKNPNLQQSKSRVDIADKERTRARAAFYPDIDFVVEGSWESDIDGVEGIRRESRVLLRGSWDLFDGFKRNAQSAKASEQYGAQLNNHTTLNREVINRIRRAWVNHETTQETTKLLEKAVEIAEKVFRARRKLRRDGRESLINVLDAERDLNGASLRLIGSQYASRVAAYRLMRDIGALDTKTLNLPH
ncbi:MAG: hypothetical protein GKS01_13775 [Alphaproteobacteria bacterium]|nr:hypothetical protein [Alphaproteobacteria bacterium]